MFTYLIFDGKYYKIGKSKNPNLRIKSLKTANPKIKLIAFGEGVEEKDLHRRYKSKRIGLEWFKLHRKDVQNIIRLLNNQCAGITISDDEKFSKYSNFKITFGKYKGYKITDFTTKEELNYLKWAVREFESSRKTKIFKWWLGQMT